MTAPGSDPAEPPTTGSLPPDAPSWWRSGDEPEDDIDDDWDWDTELGKLDPGPEPGPPRPWLPPADPPPRLLQRDVRVVVLDDSGAGEFVRSCRAAVGWSQRDLAAAAGVPQSTVARLEAAEALGSVRLATVVRLAQACGVQLVGRREPADAEPALLRGDRAQRHADNGGRMLPAHLVNQPVGDAHGSWWGDDRYTLQRARPRRVFFRDRRYPQLRDPDRPEVPPAG